MFFPPLIRLILIALAVVAPFSAALAEPAFIGASSPRTGLLQVIHDSDSYLGFDYYDWDADWGPVTRQQTATEEPSVSRFIYRNTLTKSKAAFTVNGSWKQTAANTFSFEASLTPEADAAMTLAQFGFTPGAAFHGTNATLTLADGETRTVPIPFTRASLGESIKTLSVRDQAGRVTTLVFEQPASISTDRGNARIVLAKDRLKAGETYRLALTLTLPDAAVFYPGPSALPSTTTGWYEFKPRSPFPAASEWSLASWLEAPAGKHGRILRKDDQLIYAGKPIKLWGLNLSYAACAPDKDLADRRANFYAALGINSVRLHKYADGPGWAGIQSPDSAALLDPAGVERLDYFIAALKKRGIYTKLSPVFIMKPGPGDREAIPFLDELGELRGGRINPRHGSFYLSTELQDLLIKQLTTLLVHKNPHTGLTYAEDPAIAYVELYNEDSALFGGVTAVMAQSPTLRARTGARFAAWLKNKYKDEAAFTAAWSPTALNCAILTNQKLPLDESWSDARIYPAGTPWFFNPDNLNTSQLPFKRRLLDTMAFLYELQNEVYARYAAAVRATGYTGELVASNWQAGRMMSHFYNLHSDALHGTIDRHNYFGGGGSFPFNSASMLAAPGGGLLSSGLQQVGDRPFMLSEWIHVAPNEWGVEGPAILGAYGMGLQGWDVSYPFQNRDTGNFAPAIGIQNWDVVAPNFLGIFPAVSRQVLRGDVTESSVVHTRHVHIPSLDEAKVGFEEKVSQNADIKTIEGAAFPAAALAAARGVVRFTDTFTATEDFDLEPFRKGDAIVSSTGQLRWVAGSNDKDGHLVINTPGTQAVVGFAQDKSFDLADVSVRPGSRYGALYVTARSPGGVLATDKAVLVTAIARARNAGAVILADSFLFNKGEMKGTRLLGPVVMEPVIATLALKRSGRPTVHLLDHTGVKTGKTLPVENGVIRIDTGRDATPYYLIEY